MSRITVHEVTIRTTSDSAGHPHGIVTGMGLRPEVALTALKQQAQEQAEKLAERYYRPVTASPSAPASLPPSAPAPSGGHPSSSRGRTHGIPGSARPGGRRPRMREEILAGRLSDDSVEWWFEVVDVRLASALMDSGESGWLAYGTLLTKGEQPLVVSGPRPPKE